MRRTRLAVAVACVISSAAAARAHDTWILPDRFHPEPGSEVVIALTSGMEFPKNDHAVEPDRLESARVRLAGGEEAITSRQSGTDHLALRLRPTPEGVVSIAVSSKPREIELAPKDVGEYLEEIGAPAGVVEAWKSAGSGGLRERYRKHATTFVRVGSGGADSSVRAPWGLDLELVPQSDPTLLGAGDRFAFQLLFRGKPLAGATVALAGSGGKTVESATTQADGQGAVRIPAAGPWLLKTVHLRPSVAAGEPWESDFATLTVEAGPPAAAAEALATVARFGAALSSGDRDGVLASLAPDVVIFEHGGAELSRDEYADHHLDGDLEYLKEIKIRTVDRKVIAGADRVVVLTRTESSGQYGGKLVASRGTETLVLELRESQWVIVHVHWSSGKSG